MKISTLCYLEKDGRYLMLLRNKKKQDVNEGKWIGVGGKTENGESPEECLCREVKEETGLILNDFKLRGILTFSSKGWEDEVIFVYTSDDFEGIIRECSEGELRWIRKEDIWDLNLWEGDRIFLELLMKDSPLFSLKLSYEGDTLTEKKLKLYSFS
ncbi:MAG: 8-oxo-dGTP diphosphatase [Lachnospiraceae bacterium]|nr:8-oxo-dGTP diphosphatase [Lachnospiraceae bacterium]